MLHTTPSLLFYKDLKIRCATVRIAVQTYKTAVHKQQADRDKETELPADISVRINSII